MIKLLKNTKLKFNHVSATSLIENLVAMVILLTIVSLFFMTIIRTEQSSPVSIYKAQLAIKKVSYEAIFFENDSLAYLVDDYIIKFKIRNLSNNTYLVEYEVLNSIEHVFYSGRKIINSEIKDAIYKY